MSDAKDTNPKDIVGTKKVPLSTLPWRVLWRVGLAMLEGACKYGRHNYRAVGVRASVYFDAVMRHLGAWWEGEDDDPDSQLSHVDKAIAGLMVLRDSMLRGNWVDDRPPSSNDDMTKLSAFAADLIEKYKDRNVTHYTIEHDREKGRPGKVVEAGVWIDWHGGNQPVDDVEVEAQLRNGDIGQALASAWHWPHTGDNGDIVRYRVVFP